MVGLGGARGGFAVALRRADALADGAAAAGLLLPDPGAKGPADDGVGGAFGISYSESSIGSEAPLILMSLLFSLSGGLSSKR